MLSFFAAAVFLEHSGCGGGSAARGAEVADFYQAVEIADTACGFDFDTAGDAFVHQHQIVFGGTLVIVAAVGLFDETVAGGGFHPIGSRTLANFAELSLQLVAAKAGSPLGEIVILEDYLHLGVAAVSFFADCANIEFHVIPIATESLADIDHHIDFRGAVLTG
jgi:hypothetical protein